MSIKKVRQKGLKKREIQRNKFFLRVNQTKKKYLYGKLLTIFTMNFISILFLYKVRGDRSKTKKKKTNHVILNKKRKIRFKTRGVKPESTREKERESEKS